MEYFLIFSDYKSGFWWEEAPQLCVFDPHLASDISNAENSPSHQNRETVTASPLTDAGC